MQLTGALSRTLELSSGESQWTVSESISKALWQRPKSMHITVPTVEPDFRSLPPRIFPASSRQAFSTEHEEKGGNAKKNKTFVSHPRSYCAPSIDSVSSCCTTRTRKETTRSMKEFLGRPYPWPTSSRGFDVDQKIHRDRLIQSMDKLIVLIK